MKTHEDKIKLNTPCPICIKPIYLGDETAHTKKGVYHLSCYRQSFYLNEQPEAVDKLMKMTRDKALKDELEFLERLLREYNTSYDLNKFGKNLINSRVRQINLIEKRKEQISKEIKK